MIPAIPGASGIISTFTKNPILYFIGGAALGWAKSFWYTIKAHTYTPLMSRICINVEVDRDTNAEMYFLINYWVDKELQKKKINNYRIASPITEYFRCDANYETRRIDDGRPEMDLYPAFGDYLLRWRGYFVSYYHGVTDAKNSTDGQGTQKTTTISLKIFGTRSRAKVEQLLEDIYLSFRSDYKYSPTFKTYGTSRYGDGWESHPLHSRSLDTVYLDENIKQEIVTDLTQFINSKDIYSTMGILYKRGYLFYGEPGTGKTSLIKALADMLKYPVYYLSLSSPSLTSNHLNKALADTKPYSFVVLEDIDCVQAAVSREFSKKTNDDDDDDNDNKPKLISGLPTITTSDLLNALDGIMSLEGRIFIMTTNYIDRLDPALIRAGRADRKFYIGNPGRLQIEAFYKEASKYYVTPPLDEILKDVKDNPTIGDVQAYITGKCPFRPSDSNVVNGTTVPNP